MSADPQRRVDREDALEDPRDDEPFALGGEFASEVAGLVGGQHARLGVEADRHRRFRFKVEAWAKKRGLPVVESEIVPAVEGATVTIPLYAITDETAVVHAVASAPARATVALEPRSTGWWSALRARLGGKPSATGDADFDAAFTVRASDEGAMRQLLDDPTRAALLAMDAWCSLTYEDGRITIRLDSPRLAGAHLLRAAAAAAAIARARVVTSAYR